VRRVIAFAFAVALIAGCGSSAKSSTRAARARRLIDQACVKYGETLLSTQPNSGVPQMTVEAAANAYSQAAISARSAAELDPTWNGASEALLQLAEALRAQSDAGMRKAVPAARAACEPVIRAIATTTTVG
jgi:hypothetical protein